MLKIKNWERFQHFKDRRPLWIKLHRTLLDDYDFHSLSDFSAKHLIMIWLVCAESDGVVPDVESLSFRLRIDPDSASKVLRELVERKFIVDDADEIYREVSAKDLANKNGFGNRYISQELKQKVWENFQGKCAYCESLERIEYDHIIPVSKGGSSEIDNLQLLCRPCNRKKRSRTKESGLIQTPATQAQSSELSRRSLEKRRDREEIEKETEKEYIGNTSQHDIKKISSSKRELEAFEVTDEIRLWAKAEDMPPPDDWIGEFKDHWLSLDDKTLSKRKDWTRTFRNRLRQIKAHPEWNPKEKARQDEAAVRRMLEEFEEKEVGS
ncbi:MAG: hypothetical protein NPIRA02_10780 [Nitrospirales bacterium]|nr:MAG: hypothetical protein NPIRA02_10780 [Nitrospirales bacterium]